MFERRLPLAKSSSFLSGGFFAQLVHIAAEQPLPPFQVRCLHEPIADILATALTKDDALYVIIQSVTQIQVRRAFTKEVVSVFASALMAQSSTRATRIIIRVICDSAKVGIERKLIAPREELQVTTKTIGAGQIALGSGGGSVFHGTVQLVTTAGGGRTPLFVPSGRNRLGTHSKPFFFADGNIGPPVLTQIILIEHLKHMSAPAVVLIESVVTGRGEPP